MFRRSETTRIVGLSLAGLFAAVLVAAASPARPPAAPPTALSADVAPCEAVAARARELGDARWSADGTGAVEALVDIVPEAPASAVPAAQVAGDPAVRAALGLGSLDSPVEVRRLPGAEVYEVSQVAGSAACQSLVFARRTPGRPAAILPSPTLQGEMCSGGYAHVGRAGGQPALIQIQRSGASPSEAAASRKPLVEIRVTPWTGAGWGRTCKVGLAFRAERKLADRLCARPADCKAFEPPAETSPHAQPGFPTRTALAERYAAATGADLSGLNYYVAFNRWKSACIVHGVYARYMEGKKSTEGVDTEGLRLSVLRSLELAARAAAAD